MMISKELIDTLRETIRRQIGPLIDSDYIYVDLPYYDNTGDILIWEGTRKFLSEIPHRQICSASKETFNGKKLNRKTVILLHGGGNFGDLWRDHQEFRMEVIRRYPENPVIVMPQSVCYQDEETLRKDGEFFSRHPNVTICVRDRASLEILRPYFSNKILLVPDMAFFLDPEELKQWAPQHAEKRRPLLNLRLDKEAQDLDLDPAISTIAERRDWPLLEKWPQELYEPLAKKIRKAEKLKKWTRIDTSRRVTDRYYAQTVRPYHLGSAVGFIAPYEEIYATRLHVTILGLLLGKRIHILDNQYKKISNFIRTWFPKELAEEMLEK